MSSHSKAAAKFIADAPRTAWHDKALFAVRTKRDKMMHEVPEWEALREASSQIKRHTLSHLAHYLEEFERNATANGIVVHWAADADEMNRTRTDALSAPARRRCRRKRPGGAHHAVAARAAQPHRAARDRRPP